MNRNKNLLTTLAFASLSALLCTPSSNAAITLLSESWDTPGMAVGDINSTTNAPLTGWAGVSLNSTNPTMLDVPGGGNVLRDQSGFGGVYGTNQNAGLGVRVRSSNGAMLNKEALQLSTLGVSAVALSFDLKQIVPNLIHVVEFSNNIGFLTSGTTGGKDNNVLLLDTIDGNTDLALWVAKSYSLQNGVDIGFTDQSYFRIRKLRPSPEGTVLGTNGTFHVYDNLLITATPVPESSTALLGGLGMLLVLRRRRN